MSGKKTKEGGFFSSLFGIKSPKDKDNKGGSVKEKKRDKHEDSEDKRRRSRSGSMKAEALPPLDGIETNVTTSPTITTTFTYNGRGSHNDDGNTTGESPQETRDRSPSLVSPSESPTTRTPLSTSNNNRPQSPPSLPSSPGEESEIAKSPVRDDTRKSPVFLSPADNRRKSPAPEFLPALSDHQADKSFNASSMELPQDSNSSFKKKSEFVPLPFAPKMEDTPPPKQRASGPPEILPEEITYENSDLMGHGSFGSVYKGRCRGQEVAVKVPKKQKLTMAELTSFRNEVKIMSVIYHPHVVLFLGACTQLGKMQIVTELCYTDVEKYLASDREKKQVSLNRRMQMARDAALGVNWLHSKCRIVHLDLKSANLLLDNNLRVKVTDFGFSAIKETLSADKAKKGTPLWMAPEVMMGNKYDEKADVYSFGIILWEILTRDVPYAHHNDYATFFRAVCIDKERPPIPPNTLPSLTHLITSCWDFDPRVRPTFEEIIFRINVVLIDCVIENDEGRDLWKKHFLLPKQELVESVLWVEFDTVIRKYVGRDDLKLDNLRSFLVSISREPTSKGKEVVTMERFDKVIKWFGVFFSPEVGPGIIHEINDLIGKSWFHGDISKEEAMERLAKQEEGTFLIRLSSTDPKTSPFTLSMTNNQHRRIRRLNVEEDSVAGYNIQSKPTVYSSLIELAERNADYNLRAACPKSDPYNPYDPYREVDFSRIAIQDSNNNNNSPNMR